MFDPAAPTKALRIVAPRIAWLAANPLDKKNAMKPCEQRQAKLVDPNLTNLLARDIEAAAGYPA